MAIIISGTELSKNIKEDLKKEIETLKSTHNLTPGLAVIIVGENPASISYVTAKQKAGENVGIKTFTKKLPKSISEINLLALIKKYNQDNSIHGILVQLPLPKHISEEKVIDSILTSKDVDGFAPVSIGSMMLGRDTFIPCTPHGVIRMLESINYSTSGKHVVIVGRSNIVGKPLANLLLGRGEFADATVTVCHSKTPNIKKYTLEADILISAVGKPNLITADMVKEGVVVIDVAVNRIKDSSREKGFRLVGDIDFENVKGKAYAISKVPGGVGPMTITMLLENTLKAAKNSIPLA